MKHIDQFELKPCDWTSALAQMADSWFYIFGFSVWRMKKVNHKILLIFSLSLLNRSEYKNTRTMHANIYLFDDKFVLFLSWWALLFFWCYCRRNSSLFRFWIVLLEFVLSFFSFSPYLPHSVSFRLVFVHFCNNFMRTNHAIISFDYLRQTHIHVFF